MLRGVGRQRQLITPIREVVNHQPRSGSSSAAIPPPSPSAATRTNPASSTWTARRELVHCGGVAVARVLGDELRRSDPIQHQSRIRDQQDRRAGAAQVRAPPRLMVRPIRELSTTDLEPVVEFLIGMFSRRRALPSSGDQPLTPQRPGHVVLQIAFKTTACSSLDEVREQHTPGSPRALLAHPIDKLQDRHERRLVHCRSPRAVSELPHGARTQAPSAGAPRRLRAPARAARSSPSGRS